MNVFDLVGAQALLHQREFGVERARQHIAAGIELERQTGFRSQPT